MSAAMLLLRHGESTWNAVRRWQGQADPPLSDRGEQQAVLAAGVLAMMEPFDLVVTSSLRRARRTGELIAEAMAVDVGEPISALDERAAGLWEGLTRNEIETRFPGYLGADRRPAGYEHDDAVIARVLPTVEHLAARCAGRRVVIVSHGGVINALERLADEDPRWERLDNLEGRWFEHVGGELRVSGPRVRLLGASTIESVSDGDEYA